MLQIKNLTVTHSKDLRVILKNFSFVLNEGEKAVVIGEEGNGKSTLLKLIYDESLVSSYAEFTGEIVKNNLRLGYLAQELSPSQKERSVASFCTDLPGFMELTPRELSEISRKLGLNPDVFSSSRPVSTLSGGEKVKLQLAGILAGNPDVLLLDEPSNDIDLEALVWLERFINSCGLPVLFVSHDETLIENTANVVIHIEQVRRKTTPRHTVERMPYRDYVAERLARLSHEEQVAREEQRDYEKQQEKFREIRAKVEHGLDTVSRQDPFSGRLMKKKMKAVQSMGRRFERERENMTQIPDVEEAILLNFPASARVPNGKTVLDLKLPALEAGGKVLAWNVELHMTGPEKVCVVGKNGVGKTTLLRLIAEQLLARCDIKAAYMPQNYEDLLDFSKTPAEFLAGDGGKDAVTKAKTFLGSVKYTSDEMEHGISELSGGQKAKLLFLKMILDGCNVLILDEPTRNFSPISNPIIRSVLKGFNGAILSVSHDRKYIHEVCGRVYRLTEAGLAPYTLAEE